MPGYNRTGPMGAGPMTGRGRGFCGQTDPGFTKRLPGATGFGRGMGRGRLFKWGWDYSMTPFGVRQFSRRQAPYFEDYTPEDTAGEINMLKKQADSIISSLDAINRRMEDLEKKK